VVSAFTKVTEMLPLLQLHGLSSKDFVPALEEFFGTSAGSSASVMTRLTTAWQQEYRQFAERDLSGVDYVYVWVDGIHFKVRLDQDRVCTLVIIGARADGKKELVALSDGHRESTESWADLLRDCKPRVCTRRCWPWAMAHWGFGQRCGGVPTDA
jgi:putative transposase